MGSVSAVNMKRQIVHVPAGPVMLEGNLSLPSGASERRGV